MYCFKCGKEIEDNDNFCRYCGTKQDGQNLNNESIQNNDTEHSEQPKCEHKEFSIINIISKSIFFICFIVAFLLAKCCGYTIVSNLKAHKYTTEDYQMAKDAGFVKGFEFANTLALEEYCSDSEYIPHNYINQFKKQFSKTILNANNILEKYGTKEQIKNEILNTVYQPCIKELENEFNNTHIKYGISKKQYCQIYDQQKDAILSEKIQILKQQRPNMYMD